MDKDSSGFHPSFDAPDEGLVNDFMEGHHDYASVALRNGDKIHE